MAPKHDENRKMLGAEWWGAKNIQVRQLSFKAASLILDLSSCSFSKMLAAKNPLWRCLESPHIRTPLLPYL